MPIALVAELFSNDKLPLAAALNCGDDEWGKVANDWIKCHHPDDSALSSMRDRQTQVFLYFKQDDNSLVGFGSLGLTQRKLAGNLCDFSVIPHVGLDTKFHRYPPGCQSAG